MADNPFAKKFSKKNDKNDHDGDEGKMPSGPHKMADGKMMDGKGKGNPFAKKMTGKHKPPFKKGKKKPAKKGRLQKFGQSY